MKFCTRSRLADVINRAKFYVNRERDVDSVGGRTFWLSHRKGKSPLTQGLNYRLACDKMPFDRDSHAAPVVYRHEPCDAVTHMQR